MTPPAAALDTADPLAHALHYARLGWRVVPIPPGLKRPGLERWQEVATTDEALIRQWYASWPTHGIGLVTGTASGIVALDVDPAHGGDDTLAALLAQHGPLPDTVEAITGGGGRHLLFRFPTLPVGKALGNSAGRLGLGLDTRGEGGQIVVAPSVHPESGRRYEWEISSRPGEVAVAELPAWLLELLTEDATVLPEGQIEGAGDMRYAWDRYSSAEGANQRAVELLSAYGWHSPRTDRHGVTYMTRPGKGARDGSGVSIGKVAPGVVYCFTSEAPPLVAERGYRLADLLAVLVHEGDREAADRGLVEGGWGLPTYALAEATAVYVAGEQARVAMTAPAQADGDMPLGPQPIDWPAFWRREHLGEDWLVQPLLPRGRQVALWARHKTGKSLLTLEIAAALATGRSCLSQSAGDPIDVIYLDMEMTEDDLHERLSDLDYGPDVDMSRLHYYLLPSLPPLDTERGGEVLRALAMRHEAQAVVIDTMARVVAGDENDADTYRDFYRCTGMGLKALGVSVLRLDHGGKDPTKGQRGSSSKGDDVDVVWQLKPAESGLELVRDVSRMSWVPERVSLLRSEVPLRHTVTSGGLWPAGTKAKADEMLAAGVTPAMKQNEALRKFKDAGGSGDTNLLRKAYKSLQERAAREMVEMSKGRSEPVDKSPWDQ